MNPTRKEPKDEFEILEIDQNLLDKEWLNQPRFFFRYARQLADARMKYEEAKANLKVVSAEADRKVRTKAADSQERITEAAINAAVLRRSDYRTAEQDVFTAKHNMDVLDAAVTALEHRKAALENLVRLHGQSYFATPRAEGDDRVAMEQAQKRDIRSRK